jgi:hypothetical protein
MIDNYEVWLIDYLDGKLNTVQVAELQLFVELHPELGSWSDLTSGFISLETEPVMYEFRDDLKRSVIHEVGIINETNFHAYFVASIDQQLSLSMQSDVEKFIRLNPDFAKDYAELQQTIFSPDLTIRFSNKNSLKHFVIPLGARRVLSYAASVLLLMSMFVWWMMKDNQVENLPVIVADKVVVSQPEKPETIDVINFEKVDIEHFKPVSQSTNTERLAIVSDKITPRSAQSLSSVKVTYLQEEDFMLFYFDGKEYLASLKTIKQNEKSSVVGLVAQNLIRKTVNAVALRTEKAEEQLSAISDKGNLSFWNIAELGVRTYNSLTDSELDLSKTTNDDGKLTGVHFQSEQLQLSKTKDPYREKK